MFSQLIGKFLVDKKMISEDKLREVLNEQATARVKLGTIAVAEGLMTEKQAEEVNHLQTQMDKRFGDIAVEKGLLTDEQVGSLLSKQGNSSMKFIQLLTEKGYISISELDKCFSDFQKEKGFTAEEMKALKDDDIDALVPLFAVSRRPYVTDLAGLILRNIMRFVSSDFYIDRMKKVESFEYSYMMGQKSVGDNTVYLAFAANDSTDGVLELASGFAKEKFTEVNDEVFDAICEFTNMNDGILASEVSEKKVDIDMEPPFVYKNQTATGTAYILPIHVNGKLVNAYIAVDSEITIGDKPYEVKVKKNAGSDVSEGSKGTVIIVDDSQLIRKMLRALLEEHGYTVIGEAANGEEAIEEYDKLRPDVITLDITMPKLDGVGALKRIIAAHPDAKAIMITAAGQRQKIVEALKVGAKQFIMKPFDKDDVLKNFEQIMK